MVQIYPTCKGGFPRRMNSRKNVIQFIQHGTNILIQMQDLYLNSYPGFILGLKCKLFKTQIHISIGFHQYTFEVASQA
jgi:hypothetical protein